MANGKELIFISQSSDGKLIIHEFAKAEQTNLGKKVKETLRNNGVLFK
jgi:hypothetical protein